VLVGKDAPAVEALLRQSLACNFITLRPGADTQWAIYNEYGQIEQLVLGPFDKAYFDERVKHGDVMLHEER